MEIRARLVEIGQVILAGVIAILLLPGLILSSLSYLYIEILSMAWDRWVEDEEEEEFMERMSVVDFLNELLDK